MSFLVCITLKTYWFEIHNVEYICDCETARFTLIQRWMNQQLGIQTFFKGWAIKHSKNNGWNLCFVVWKGVGRPSTPYPPQSAPVSHTRICARTIWLNSPSVSIQPTRLIQNNPKLHIRQCLSLHKKKYNKFISKRNLLWKKKKILHNNHTLYFLMGSHYYNDDNLLHKIFLISTSLLNYIVFYSPKIFPKYENCFQCFSNK